jgi:putative transcriptional regulator
MKKEIKFNEAEFIGSMQEALGHSQGKLTLKTAKLPPKVRSISPAGIARIRRQLRASTPVFAAYLNVKPETVRSWEKNRRHPSGTALRLLQIAQKQPKILLSA